MGIGKRLICLILFVMVVFTVVVFVQRHLEVKRLRTLFLDRKQADSRNFAQIVDLKNKKLESFVVVNTYWDELVKAVETKDAVWFKSSVEPSITGGNDYSGVWIFNNGKLLVYSGNNQGMPQEFPVPVEAFDLLLNQNALCHFFLQTEKGTMEINGAKIYPGDDPDRKTRPRGYLFAGKVWDREYIKEISDLTAGSIIIVPYSKESLMDKSSFKKGTIFFTQTLCGWDKTPLNSIQVTAKFSQIENFNSALRSNIFLLLVFIGILTAAILFFVARWVAAPLKLISETLRKDDVSLIGVLLHNKSELGDISRLIRDFFQQRLELVKEITERKRAEESMKELNCELEWTIRKLEHTNQEMRNFTHIASHDLREPMRKISAFGDLLVKSLAGKISADDRENLQFMIDGAARMTKMIEGLLAYSKVSTKTHSAEIVDLNNIVKQLSELELSVMLEEKHTILDVPQSLPAVEVDPVQIRQLMQNLVANGMKYQAKENKPHITITSRPVADGMVRINVTDNGIGIAPEFQQAVFVMFKRLHAKNEYEGTGIGLAVCKKIIGRHGGQIGVESELGKGSTFWFTLPAVKQSAAINQELEICV
jgi:signal transduction histidine kinase